MKEIKRKPIRKGQPRTLEAWGQKTHKRYRGGFYQQAACQPKLQYVLTRANWKDVTCKRCLKLKRQTKSTDTDFPHMRLLFADGDAQ